MSLRPVLLAAALVVAPIASPVVLSSVAGAQTAAEHVAIGDREREMNPTSALAHYQAALKTEPTDFDALTKAAYAAIETGQAQSEKEQQRTFYKQAEDLARRAIAIRPNAADGHFVLATALGRTAQTLGARDRVRYAADVRAQALEALKYEPRHAGALHVMGMWNAEVMRLSGITRFMAKNFLGGQVFASANWNDAQRYLEQAVQIEPQRITHRIDLAEVYLDRGDKVKAREQLDAIAAAPARELNDTNYKKVAESLRSRAS